MGVKRETEKSFMAAVVAFAKLNGWLCYHTHDSRRSEPGFPDLVLVKGTSVIFAELKVGNNPLTEAQQDWLKALAGAGQYAVVWRPDYWNAIESALKG